MLKLFHNKIEEILIFLSSFQTSCTFKTVDDKMMIFSLDHCASWSYLGLPSPLNDDPLRSEGAFEKTQSDQLVIEPSVCFTAFSGLKLAR